MKSTTADPSLRSGRSPRSRRGGGVHTVPAKTGGWWNTVDGWVVPLPSKKDAVRYGRALARKLKVEHTIHRRDGVITEKNSYGNDPCPPKDR